MGLLNKIRAKGEEIQICAPCAGKLIALHEVSDPAFGAGILGQGIAIMPSDGKFYAPADGVVAALFPTGHAAAIRTAEGAEVLLHIGLDTVKLNGKHFTIHAEAGQQVRRGDLLLEADLAAVAAAGYDTVTPVVVCNFGDFAKIETSAAKAAAAGDVMFRLIK